MHRRQHALSQFRRAAANDRPLSGVIAEALDLAQHSLQAERCAYAERVAGRDDFILVAGHGWTPSEIGHARFSGLPGALAEHTTRLARPVIIEDASLFEGFGHDAPILGAGIRSALLAPVRSQGGSPGLLGIFGPHRRLFTPDDAEFLLGLADVIAAARYREEWRSQLAGRSGTPHRTIPVHLES